MPHATGDCRLRVLMLTDCFPPYTGGGVEKVTAELAAGLVRRGHAVRVLTLRTSGAATFEENGNLSVVRVPALDLTSLLGVQFLLPFGLLRQLRRQLHRFRPDVVHAHNLFFRTTEAAALLCHGAHLPLVTTLHLGALEGGEWWLRCLVGLYEASLGRYVLNHSDRITAVSRAVARHGKSMAPGAPVISVIPNAVDAEVFYPGPAAETATVVFVGRLVPNKGPLTLLQAAATVLAERPGTRFLMVGEGPQRRRLEREVGRLGITGAVSFAGLRRDVPEILRRASVFVRPSTLEGMSLTVLEAMATGLPVVATPVGGTPEIISHGVQGYLVPVADAAALAEALLKLLRDPAAGAEMGRRGRELVLSGHTWDIVVRRTAEVYEEVVGG